jgi:lipoate synthase
MESENIILGFICHSTRVLRQMCPTGHEVPDILDSVEPFRQAQMVFKKSLQHEVIQM